MVIHVYKKKAEGLFSLESFHI